MHSIKSVKCRPATGQVAIEVHLEHECAEDGWHGHRYSREIIRRGNDAKDDGGYRRA